MSTEGAKQANNVNTAGVVFMLIDADGQILGEAERDGLFVGGVWRTSGLVVVPVSLDSIATRLEAYVPALGLSVPIPFTHGVMPVYKGDTVSVEFSDGIALRVEPL
jgi:hypothetical protein